MGITYVAFGMHTFSSYGVERIPSYYWVLVGVAEGSWADEILKELRFPWMKGICNHYVLEDTIGQHISYYRGAWIIYEENRLLLDHIFTYTAELQGKLELQGKFALEYVNLSFNNFDGDVPTKGVFANASAISVAGNSMLCGGILELHLPRCPVEATKRSKLRLVKIAVVVISIVFGITILSTATYYRFRKKKREQSPTSLQIRSFQKISYEMILKATDGLSSANLIGVGSFGSVYEGTSVEDGAIFAVKVLDLQQRGASKSFMAECKVLRNVRHRNLVKIITSCSSVDFQGNDFKALVYEGF
ncbi:probable LRR receptor-like serine/threonine-protein kinase At3g47570 [Hevea brasiliensis]|uniref:probable LRR receptor-like serine/threonine-protein kinase At3g47570 n=1 Tax=Hevea brasiliensis TaxID=3981 RepID=UPI0025CE5DBD|nr:probable LRR receptor-like serine/threonine-protein kinase At3g47570 [Hevea brasiliensis]